MKSRTGKALVAELVEDFTIYPRCQVDLTHVNHISEAIEAGAKLPLIIVEEKTKRIIDGLHRSRAYKRLYGDDYSLEVELREYDEEADLLIDAMQLNSGHGRNMSTSDRAHAILLASKLHADDEAVAGALNITVERMIEIKRTLTIKVENTRQRVPLKMPIRHMSGQELTEAQAAIVPKLGGNQAMFWVNQLIMLIEHDMIDTTNEPLIERLETLAGMIEKMECVAG